ncbi:MAG: biotin--[acetyl-CoA-carboxylase] ligase [Gemmatimonadaceae bacterium]
MADPAPPRPLTGSRGSYDGVPAGELASRLGVPMVVATYTTGSTLDDAHRLAEEGAPHGTLVLADRQVSGRGRQGRAWHSAAGQGIWLTLLARDLDAATVGVLAIRLGIAAATPLDHLAGSAVRLKWPNDLYVGDRKLAGVLVEARWQAGRASWIAIGFGLNVRAPAGPVEGAALRGGVDRLRPLEAIVPALLGAVGESGPLRPPELEAFAARDLAVGRRCSSPLAGRVLGLAADGGLLVQTADGVRTSHAGSLVLDPPELP